MAYTIVYVNFFLYLCGRFVNDQMVNGLMFDFTPPPCCEWWYKGCKRYSSNAKGGA